MNAKDKYIEYVVNDMLENNIQMFKFIKKGTNRFIQFDYFAHTVFDQQFSSISTFWERNINGAHTKSRISERYAIVDNDILDRIMDDLNNYCMGEHEAFKFRVMDKIYNTIDLNTVTYRGTNNTVGRDTIGTVRKMVNNINFGQTDHEKLNMIDDILERIKGEKKRREWNKNYTKVI
jgi:hypothetical protein